MLKRKQKHEQLSVEKKFDIINSKAVKPEVLKYLKNKLNNLTIEILGDFKGNILDLMKQGYLEGWCWQTTETSIIFFNDEDYIERGDLTFEKDSYYYHSWICFKYEKEEYILDPCLNLLCKKDLYHKIFEVNIKGRVTAKQVRDELIAKINIPKKEEISEAASFMRKFLEKHCSSSVLERQRQETHISGNNDVNSPMYRNNTGYNAEIENGKIKKLVAHYYMNG